MRVETLKGQKIIETDPAMVREGDEVDIPVSFDVWFPPAGLNIAPMVYLTFDRLVIIGSDRKVMSQPYR